MCWSRIRSWVRDWGAEGGVSGGRGVLHDYMFGLRLFASNTGYTHSDVEAATGQKRGRLALSSMRHRA